MAGKKFMIAITNYAFIEAESLDAAEEYLDGHMDEIADSIEDWRTETEITEID